MISKRLLGRGLFVEVAEQGHADNYHKDAQGHETG